MACGLRISPTKFVHAFRCCSLLSAAANGTRIGHLHAHLAIYPQHSVDVCAKVLLVGYIHKYVVRGKSYILQVHTSGKKLLWCVWPKSQDLVRGGSNQITYHTHHLMGMKKYSGRTWMVSSRKHICVLDRIPRTFLLLLHGQGSLVDELYFIKLWSILIAINFDFQFNLWGAEHKTHKRKVPQLPPLAKNQQQSQKNRKNG